MVFKIKKKARFYGEGLFLFEKVEDAIKAEKVLKSADYMVKLVAPPPTLRKGCDLAVEINLVEQIGIERLFNKKDVDYIEVVPLKGDGELLEIVKVTDFGEAVMVKAGNMKLTFDRNTGIILNASRGGCPDIPSLHAELINKKLTDAPRPKDVGFTLCVLMMDRVFVECLDLWKKAKEKQDDAYLWNSPDKSLPTDAGRG
jgi:hypothetical protein